MERVSHGKLVVSTLNTHLLYICTFLALVLMYNIEDLNHKAISTGASEF